MDRYDLIIAGAGIAGLSTALSAAPRRVLLVCRGTPGSDGASAWAQGGIAAAIGPGDDPSQHAEDTLAAGSGVNDRGMVDLLTGDAPAIIDWLTSIGLQFDRDADGACALGREGGHRRHRILHAGGDATGRELMRALGRAILRAGHVDVRVQTRVDGLLLAGTRIVGARLVDERDAAVPTHIDVAAPAVVLATGGIGALYRYTTNPDSADGSGLALALAAGARGADLEFVQFHPTALAPPPGAPGHRLALVTEALRGAGATLVTASGRRLMQGVHPLADLAPRDIVARTVWAAQAGGDAVHLDATLLGESLREQFPTVHAFCSERGIDPARDPIPIVPAQHFHMGGVAADALGRSTLDGLFAVGEVACNGVHGANRLASNSLLEGTVFGRRLGLHLAAASTASPPTADRAVMLDEGLDEVRMETLRALLWQAHGLVRDGVQMQRAIDTLTDGALVQGWQGRLALALLQAARARRTSLGSHFRSDG